MLLFSLCVSCSGGGGTPTDPGPPGDPGPPHIVGTVATVCSEDMVVLGDYVYVADGPAGVKVIDASDKSNPVVVSEIATTYAIRIYIYQNYLYVCDGPDGIKVFWLGDPSNPQFTFSEDSEWATSATFHAGHMYMGDYFGGFKIYDVSNPAQPLYVTSNLASIVRDVCYSGDHLLVCSAPFGVALYMADPPGTTKCLWCDGTRMYNHEDVVGYGEYAIIARNDEASNITVVNIPNVGGPSVEREISVKRFIPSITISGDYLLAACGEDGFVVFGLTDLPGLENLYEVDTPGYARRVKMEGDFIYVADMAGLSIYTNPLSKNANAVVGISIVTEYQREMQVSDPHPEFFNLRNLFGDIHCHTIFSDGDESPDFALRYARDVSRLDFCCLTDHDCHFANDNWVAEDYYREVQLKYDDPGVFSVLFGFEWTSLAGGHRTVISPYNTLPILPYVYSEFDTIDEVWAGLAGYDAITIPHYPMMHTPDWDNHHNPEMEQAMELYSKHGLFADLVVRGTGLLDRNYSVVAASDTHQSRPGSYLKECRQDDWFWSPRSALTGVWAPENTREDIFNAIRDGHCYGIMGKPVEVQFTVNGSIMGSTIQAANPPEISFLARSWDELITLIQIVEIDENGMTILQSYTPNVLEYSGTWFVAGFSEDSVYSLVVYMANEDLALTTPVWVEKI